MRVLLVEDDAVLMNGLQLGLGLAGFTVDAVTSCADASAALRGSAFDAIVLDLMLPVGSGLMCWTSCAGVGSRRPFFC